MAFNITYLTLLSQGGRLGLRRWEYVTTDAPTAVDAAGYFNGAINDLKIGDRIEVIQLNSLTAPTSVTDISYHVVVSNNGTDVDVSDDLYAFTIADSD